MEVFSPRKRLDTPTDYEFPFKPYKIQQELMEAVYGTLNRKGIGIFESPTGTGKSLTLTCASLRWLEDHEKLVRRDLCEHSKQLEQEVKRLISDANMATDWVTANFEVAQQKKNLAELQEVHRLLKEHEERLQEIRERQAAKQKKRRRPRKAGENANFQIEDDVEMQWEEQDVGGTESEEDALKEENARRYRHIQVFFCSRTHSQLTQVVREVQRSAYGKRVRCVSLASRQHLCVNSHVRGLPSVSLMNERCIDMSRNPVPACSSAQRLKQPPLGAKATRKCCAFRNAAAVQQLSEATLVDVMDIEELVREGEASTACPYYAARAAQQSAQLVMLPYQMLLHRRTRLQMGIDLRGAVLVIDEAHNLLDTIAQLHSCELTLQHLVAVQHQLGAYKMRYAKRFSTPNLLRINQLLFVAKRLAKLLQQRAPPATAMRCVLRTYELAAEGEFYNINLVDLLDFCERSRLAQKLQGFAEQQNRGEPPCHDENVNVKSLCGISATQGLLQQLQHVHEQSQHRSKKKCSNDKSHAFVQDKIEDDSNTEERCTKLVSAGAAPLRALVAFVETMTENAEDGRVLLHVDTSGNGAQSAYKYILLNPGSHFEDVVRDARAIIIAGGTMQPTAELTDQLFRSCMERVQLHIYDHVVASDAVLPFVVAQGPSGRHVCFNYAQRNSEEMLLELGMILQNVCHVVPAGLVCFLPSYEYLDTIYKHLQQSGILARISARKRIFCEPRSTITGSSVEKLLANYSAAIKSEDGGALLFSVVGGKLSEGLNFADDLGRGVMVVGMPYPNRQSLELQERMKYLDVTLKPGAGNEYYENLCMKAVNQCIGRSVRHINDFASVFLVDERYGRECIQQKLPQWIARGLLKPTSFGAVQATTARFFKQKKLKV